MTSEHGDQAADKTQTTPPADDQSQDAGGNEASERAKRRLLIGSERTGAAAHRAQPQHRPISVPRAGDDKPQTPPGAPQQLPPAAPSTPAASTPATPSAPPQQPSQPRVALPREDNDAGLDETIAYQPKTSPPPRPSGKPVPAPSRRQPLSAELEQELADALGDMSLDDIISAEAKSGGLAAAGAVLEPGSHHQGQVLSVGAEEVFVELGQRQQGVVPLTQFAEPPLPGAQCEFIITGYNREDELYSLGLPGAAMEVADWSDIHEGGMVDALISGHNKGGLECKVNSLRGFIPAGQVSLYRVEDFSEFVGQKMTCLILEANPEKRNLVLSRKAVLERERAAAKERFLAEVEPGKTFEGVVRKIMDFGAFVELGNGVDGLVHVSKLSWGRVNHPKDVLKEGDQVKVRVEKIDADTGKISLSMKDMASDPWLKAPREYFVGAKVNGRVSKIMEFGAFVELEPGIEGLIHISELAHSRTFRVRDVLSEGQEVEVQVLNVDPDTRRIALSIKALQAAPVREEKKDQTPEINDSEHTKELEKIRKQRKTPLRGGTKKDNGGSQFGLNW